MHIFVSRRTSCVSSAVCFCVSSMCVALMALLSSGSSGGGVEGFLAYRLRRFVPNKSQHFLIKFALKECKIAPSCWSSVEQSLLNERRVLECEEMDFYKMLYCLDQVIMTRTNVTDLNSKTGSVCCETIDGASVACRAACRSALYAPTLSASKKLNRIHTICDKSDAAADSSVLNCLATTDDWLQEKFKF